MHHRMFLLIAVLPLLGGGCVNVCIMNPPPPAPLSDEVNLLDALDMIEGSGIGFGGRPGRFHTLAKQFLAKGTPADFERLANDKVPLTRAMGLYCLARSKADRAVPVLQAHLNDDWPVNVEIGCAGGGRMTIGGFAAKLLRNRNYLELEEQDPMLPAAQVFVADVLRLASDKPFEADNGDYSRDDLFYLVRDQIQGKQVTLDAAGFAKVLRYLPPSEPRWRLVKGIGRGAGLPWSWVRSWPTLGPDEVSAADIIGRFLAERLHDRNEDTKVRLAAASALTRIGDDASAEAIRSEAAFLNGVDPRLAERLLAAAALRKTLTRWLQNKGNEKLEPPADLTASDHPMVLDYFQRPRRVGPDLGEGQLARIAKPIGEFGRAWDTYSDAVWELERMSASEMSTTDAIDGEIAAIRRDVNRAIRARE